MTMYLRLLPHPGRWIGKEKGHHLWQGCLPTHTWAHEHNTLLASTFPSLWVFIQDSRRTPRSIRSRGKEGNLVTSSLTLNLLSCFSTSICNFPQCYSEIGRTSLSFWTPSSLKSFSKAPLSWGTQSNSGIPSSKVEYRTAARPSSPVMTYKMPGIDIYPSLSLYFTPWRPVAAVFYVTGERQRLLPLTWFLLPISTKSLLRIKPCL